MFTGSYVALVTPMYNDGSIDYQSLQKLVDFHIQQGTDGIVAVGTTGESATLPFDEHIEVVKRTLEFVDKRVPVIAGSGANATAEAIFLSEEMATLGVDGFLSVVPYYNKPQQAGMIAHFNAIANATDVPLLLYNVPGRTVADMLPETVAELATHPKIVGLKDATGDLSRLHKTLSMVPSDFVFLSGDDATSSDFLCQGGHGVISVTANILPNAMATMCAKAAQGDHQGCHDINAAIKAFHHTLFIEPNPVIPKWALYKMGLISSPVMRLPMVLPAQAHQVEIEQLLEQHALLQA